MRRPSSAGKDALPSSPFIRGNIRSATVHRSQTVVPSSPKTATTPRAPRMLRRGASRSVRLATAEGPEEQEEGRTKQNHEHGGKDQEDEGKQDLDRCLLGLLLRDRTSPAPHLMCEVTHDLTNRDAECLALDNRADERA